jgi:hypothetical protein
MSISHVIPDESTRIVILTLLGAVWNFNPVMSEMASATLTSKPFLVFNP